MADPDITIGVAIIGIYSSLLIAIIYPTYNEFSVIWGKRLGLMKIVTELDTYIKSNKYDKSKIKIRDNLCEGNFTIPTAFLEYFRIRIDDFGHHSIIGTPLFNVYNNLSLVNMLDLQYRDDHNEYVLNKIKEAINQIHDSLGDINGYCWNKEKRGLFIFCSILLSYILLISYIFLRITHAI